MCRDFNVNLLCNNINISHEFLHRVQTCSLISTIAKPTKIADETSTLIANIFIIKPIIDIFGILINDISDHLIIFIIKENFFNDITKQENTIQYRIVNEKTLRNLYSLLQN